MPICSNIINISSLIDITIKHFLFDVFSKYNKESQLVFGKVVKNKMVFETIDNEI